MTPRRRRGTSFSYDDLRITYARVANYADIATMLPVQHWDPRRGRWRAIENIWLPGDEIPARYRATTTVSEVQVDDVRP